MNRLGSMYLGFVYYNKLGTNMNMHIKITYFFGKIFSNHMSLRFKTNWIFFHLKVEVKIMYRTQNKGCCYNIVSLCCFWHCVCCACVCACVCVFRGQRPGSALPLWAVSLKDLWSCWWELWASVSPSLSAASNPTSTRNPWWASALRRPLIPFVLGGFDGVGPW